MPSIDLVCTKNFYKGSKATVRPCAYSSLTPFAPLSTFGSVKSVLPPRSTLKRDGLAALPVGVPAQHLNVFSVYP